MNCHKFECFSKAVGLGSAFIIVRSIYVVEPRNVYNYVINLAHLKHSPNIYRDKNVTPKHEQDDKLLGFHVARSSRCCLQIRVQSVRLQLDFFHFS